MSVVIYEQPLKFSYDYTEPISFVKYACFFSPLLYSVCSAVSPIALCSVLTSFDTYHKCLQNTK